MKTALLVSFLLSAVLAAPQYQYDPPAAPDTLYAAPGGGGGPDLRAEEEAAIAAAEAIEIVKDEREQDVSGAYSYAIEESNGSVREETGTPGENGAVIQTGSWSFTLPDGQIFEMKFVADENGFQPESPFLPPLPDFVLEQIEFAKNNPEEEAVAASKSANGAPEAPSDSYLTPQ